MSDLDFEELDKAVNNHISNKAPSPPQEPAAASAEPAHHLNVSVAPRPEISKQSRGQFMDVVHPSSDMSSKPAVTTEVTERSAYPPRKIVNPIYNDVKVPAEPVKKEEISTAVPATSQKEDEVVVKNDWPDPIDAATSSSLFLPDAKVEKRPLGGFAQPSTPAEEPPVTAKETHDEQPVADSAAKPDDRLQDNPVVEPSLPPELEAGLVAIEEREPFDKKYDPNSIERNNNQFEKSEAEPTEPSISETSSQQNHDHIPDDFGYIETESVSKKISKEPTTPKPEPTKAELSGLLGAGSIPQQYKTAAVSPEPAATHPMFFDADHLDKDAGSKSKSTKTTVFQWIFIVVGLLLLGATLGAALFVFVNSK